jgi:hypothetical protein
MMTGTEVGRELAAASKELPHNECLNTGGNTGMVFIASAIQSHADAIRELAGALDRLGLVQATRLASGSAKEGDQ